MGDGRVAPEATVAYTDYGQYQAALEDYNSDMQAYQACVEKQQREDDWRANAAGLDRVFFECDYTVQGYDNLEGIAIDWIDSEIERLSEIQNPTAQQSATLQYLRTNAHNSAGRDLLIDQVKTIIALNNPSVFDAVDSNGDGVPARDSDTGNILYDWNSLNPGDHLCLPGLDGLNGNSYAQDSNPRSHDQCVEPGSRPVYVPPVVSNQGDHDQDDDDNGPPAENPEEPPAENPEEPPVENPEEPPVENPEEPPVENPEEPPAENPDDDDDDDDDDDQDGGCGSDDGCGSGCGSGDSGCGGGGSGCGG